MFSPPLFSLLAMVSQKFIYVTKLYSTFWITSGHFHLKTLPRHHWSVLKLAPALSQVLSWIPLHPFCHSQDRPSVSDYCFPRLNFCHGCFISVIAASTKLISHLLRARLVGEVLTDLSASIPSFYQHVFNVPVGLAFWKSNLCLSLLCLQNPNIFLCGRLRSYSLVLLGRPRITSPYFVLRNALCHFAQWSPVDLLSVSPIWPGCLFASVITVIFKTNIQ